MTRSLVGKKSFPYSLKLAKTGVAICDILEAHELGSDIPFLLSLRAQRKRGMVKDVRKGKCKLLNYGGEELEFVRHSKSGLLMAHASQLRDIDDNDSTPMLLLLEEYRLEQEPICQEWLAKQAAAPQPSRCTTGAPLYAFPVTGSTECTSISRSLCW